MKRKFTLLIAILALQCSYHAYSQTVTDIDGNTYNTVTIGTQVWMKENLAVTRYQNGDSIGTTNPETLDISTEVSPKYQWRVGYSDSLLAIYGRHYTWYAATDSRNVCPVGWSVPTDADWTTLTNFLGGNLDSVGGPLKETGTTHWNSPNTGADNSSGFTALPGGGREPYAWVGQDGCFWSSTLYFSTYAKYRRLFSYETEVYDGGQNMHYGYNIRCIEGGIVGIENNTNNPFFKLFPNPCNGQFKIEIANATTTSFDIEIHNILGERIYVASNLNKNCEVDLSNSSKGIYFVKISAGGKAYTHKIIVQ